MSTRQDGTSTQHDDVHGEYRPGPSSRVREQVALYEASDGREDGTLEDRPVVILTTKGAKTGDIRKTPVMRIEQGGTYVVVASAGGAPKHPLWYHNVVAHPDVRLQDHDRIHRLRAREVFGEERDRWWTVVDAFWPHFPEYRTKAGREIPVLVLEPKG
jgi:F420H(2)-dependent quinone reductase